MAKTPLKRIHVNPEVLAAPTIKLTIYRNATGSIWYATATLALGTGPDDSISVTASIPHRLVLKAWEKYRRMYGDSTSGLLDSLSDIAGSIPGVKAVKGIVKTIAKTVPIKKLVGPVLKAAGQVSEKAIREAYRVATLARLGVSSALKKVASLKKLGSQVIEQGGKFILKNPVSAKALQTIRAVSKYVPKLGVQVFNAGKLSAEATQAVHSGDIEGAISKGRASLREMPAPVANALATTFGGPAGLAALHAARTADEIHSGKTPRAPAGFNRGLALVPPLMAVV